MAETCFYARRSLPLMVSFLAVVILAVSMFFIGCDRNEPVSTEDISKSTSGESESSAEPPIVLAVHPYASPVELVKNFMPLIEYLRERTGRGFSLVISRNYETHIARVVANEVDIALIGPALYVSMPKQFGKKRLLCCFETNGSPDYQGYIISRKDSAATSLADLQGKSFASTSRNSTMSYFVPRYMFISAGVPFPDSQLRVVGSHNNVCLNILAGDVYAGGVREKTYQKYKDRNLKVIAVSPKLTGHPFVATDRLDDETFAQIKKIMLNINSKEEIEMLLKPIKSTLTGLAAIEDKDYDQLRAIMAVVREDERRLAEEGEKTK